MPETSGMRVAAIGDIHAAPGDADRLHELFRQAREDADVLVLCGDLTNLGTAPEAQTLAHALRDFGKPILAVLGNHDHEAGTPGAVEAPLREVGVRFLEAQTCVVEGVGFAGVKGFAGGFGKFMLASFGEDCIKSFVHESVQQSLRLETALSNLPGDQPALVVLHYAPIAETVMGEPREIFPFLGSSRLAEVVDRFDNVRAIVHGHAHLGPFRGTSPAGKPVYNCAAQIEKDTGRAYALIRL